MCPEYDEFAEFYDYVVPYQNRQDVAFYVEFARDAPTPVLELACGTGRVLLPSARAGAAMVGLDISGGMLDVCRTTLAADPPEVQARVTLHQGDMRDFDLGRTFALITIPFRGFQHLLTVADQQRALACVRRHLAPGGRFVFDLFNPSMPFLADERWLREPLTEPAVPLPDGRTLVRSYRVAGRDYHAQTQEVELVHVVTWPDGRMEQLGGRFLIRYLFRYEAEHLLVREGFTIDALYSDFDRNPYGASYPGELIFVARRADA
jgi:SAM-dependent methyltransferase